MFYLVFFFWAIAPALYFSNTWYAKYMPILSNHAFDNTGQYYNVTRILTPENTLDLAKYKAYSPLFLPTVYAIQYGLSFAAVCATLSHAALYFRKQIWTQSRRSLSEQRDIHGRLMSVYPQVPEWWYAVIFCEHSFLCVIPSLLIVVLQSPSPVSMLAFGIISIEKWPTQMPVWAFIVALLIAFVYVIPIGMIQAITKSVQLYCFYFCFCDSMHRTLQSTSRP